MKRFHQEKNLMRRRYKENLLRRPNSFIDNKEGEIGRYRKSSPHDCGNPACQLCHGEKFPRRELTLPERRAELKLKESSDE